MTSLFINTCCAALTMVANPAVSSIDYTNRDFTPVVSTTVDNASYRVKKDSQLKYTQMYIQSAYTVCDKEEYEMAYLMCLHDFGVGGFGGSIGDGFDFAPSAP